MTQVETCLHCGSASADSDECPDVNKGRSIDRRTLKHTNSTFYAECGTDYEIALTRLEQMRRILHRLM